MYYESASTIKTLTISEQVTGQQRYLWFTRINAISFACLGDSILLLFAIKMGSADFLIGLIASFIYLTMPSMFLNKKMVGRSGAARTYAISWILRNSSAALLIEAPIVINFSNAVIGQMVLVMAAFDFFFFRSMGITANTPLLGEITDKSNRGQYISKIWLNFNLFYLIAMLLLIYIMRHRDGIILFQFIIAFGVVVGMISAFFIYRVPETSNPIFSAQIPMSRSISHLWQNNHLNRLHFSWISISIMIMLISPFSMVAMKKGYFISDHNALLFALIQVIGSICAAFFNSKILDRVGPRPILILNSGGFLISVFLWIIAPPHISISYTALIFFINGFCNAGANTALSHYFLATVAEEDRVGVSLFIYMSSGLITGLTGTFIGGGLLTLLRSFQLSGMMIYHGYFAIIFLILIPLLFIIQKIEPIEDWSIRDFLGVFVSFRDLRALFVLRQFEKNKNSKLKTDQVP